MQKLVQDHYSAQVCVFAIIREYVGTHALRFSPVRLSGGKPRRQDFEGKAIVQLT